MIHLLLAVIYVSFISLGLPDSMLGAGIWGSGLLFRRDLLYHTGGNSALQPAK